MNVAAVIPKTQVSRPVKALVPLLPADLPRVENIGLSLPVLAQAFPQGLDADESAVACKRAIVSSKATEAVQHQVQQPDRPTPDPGRPTP
jgi:hypothetical protein